MHVSLGLITLDSGSMMILFAEWQRLYEDAGAALPPLPTSFRDYVLAERALQGTPLFQRAERYWQRRVEALPPRRRCRWHRASPAPRPASGG
ncbi:hypothetical protein ACFQU7_36565 [Pseudoroseomonas wenyumeiae]